MQPADSSVEFWHTRRLPFISRFDVYVEGRRVFEIRYSRVARLLWALIDITYDKIDQNSDFFLEFVAENANSPGWRNHVLEQWRSSQAV